MSKSRPAPGTEKLEKIRARFEGASASPVIVADAAGLAIAVPAQDGSEFDKLAIFPETTRFGDQEFYTHAHEDMGFVLRQLDRAKGRIEELYRKYPDERPRAPKDFAQDCAIHCEKGAFRRFLTERHGLETTDRERTATRVRTMLQIESRSELNTDPAATARWMKLRADFEAWMRSA